ncbi:excisionase family DNA-binding protein [Streptomyces sp. NPDC091268]|uniref:excisionase family DNA-binding protein n=1 Tax=Streptomyces sp. NPDC091268 TaxID=3365979 RepID=UPI0037FFA7CA
MGRDAASSETRSIKGANYVDHLLSVDEAAERLGTGVRFIRRLISERRIEYVKLGKHVRVADSVLTAYVAVRTVAPVRTRRAGYGTAA